ncbi:MAG: sensor histidine kinase [Citromicrobium sp.]|nr:MAG: sensor histidine kinase [Citromicrobium sp.]
MLFDDRLATVLRHRAAGERAAKTQFRQLIDLLGERPMAGDRALKAAAYLRLIALGEMVPTQERARIVGESGWRFRNPELVRWFGEAHPHIASAALCRAQLTGSEWAELIPTLPIRARGFLRHRNDLPDEALTVLDRLGVSDRGLPLPEPLELVEEDQAIDPEPSADSEEVAATTPSDVEAEPATASEPKVGIRAIVDRIEEFQRARSGRNQVGESAEPQGSSRDQPLDNFVFATNAHGRIDRAESEILPMVYGIDLTALHGTGSHLSRSIEKRQPIRGTPVALRGASSIEGEWMIEATPRFTPGEGRFVGYIGKFRRAISQQQDAQKDEADRMRQLLHELRTPVNAMQGYAEIIQQQMMGSVPHEYRAIAASIAGDAAHILAGFDELDRLARLETGALDLEDGQADFAEITRLQLAQLQGVLSPRISRFELDLGEQSAPINLSTPEVERLAWRLLATVAAAMGAGETVGIALATQGNHTELALELPALLRNADDVFSADVRSSAGALSAGIFGAGFSLRLARAEARAGGGELSRIEDRLILSLPLLTAKDSLPSPERQIGSNADDGS